ncbi:MAG: c-type cytochrome, partial [Planctomycetales bacterium]|nr:c-type cytochrome [Planctomycetales bacterium]
VYRLRGVSYTPGQRRDLAALSSAQLVAEYLDHPNRWYRQTALRLLGDRRDASIVPQLVRELSEQRGSAALNRLWGIHASGGWSETFAQSALRHEEPAVRRWTVRLLGDAGECSDELAQQLIEQAKHEPDVETRLQLAASAIRFDANVGLEIAFKLLLRIDDVNDPYVPNMLWWAIERHAKEQELVMSHLRDTAIWLSPYRVAGASITELLMRRYAMIGNQPGLSACARLLELAPTTESRQRLVAAFSLAHEGRSLPPLPRELADALARDGGTFSVMLGVRQQKADDIERALSQLAEPTRDLDERIELVRALADVRATPTQTVPALLALLHSQADERLQLAMLGALVKFDDGTIPAAVLDNYSEYSLVVQSAARQALASRAEWAALLLESIDKGLIAANELEPDTIERLRRYSQVDLATAVAKHFPAPALDATALDRQIDRIEQIILQGSGDPLSGRTLFAGKATCAKCHRLFAKGADIGPDLTSFNRTNLRRMLLAVVHPSAEIREGFGSFTVITTDGRVLSGLKIEQNDNVLVLRGSDGQDQVIAVADIDELLPNTQSMMPVGLLDGLTDDEVRDLFAYLTSTTPPL